MVLADCMVANPGGFYDDNDPESYADEVGVIVASRFLHSELISVAKSGGKPTFLTLS